MRALAFVHILIVLWLTGFSIEANAAGKRDATISEAQYLESMNDALDDVLAQLRPKSKARVEFSANLFFAHEVMIEHVPLATLLKYVDALVEAGVHRIDINPGLFPWVDKDRETIAKYDALIAHIRKSGVKLVFNPQYSAVHHKIRGFEAWQAAVLPVYAELARRYQPDIFIVVHEPTTMAARMGVEVSPKDWKAFAQTATGVVKEHSPKTRCGAGGLFWEKNYFAAFLDLRALDVATLDIYNLRGLKTYNKMIKQARRHGKQVYIEETWRSPYFVHRPGMTLEAMSMTGVGKSTYTSLDIKWMETMTAYASAWNLEAVTPFWTPTFFKYVEAGGDAMDPEYLRQVMDAIDRGERTPTFHAFKELIQQWGEP